jgi:hypothetical protein
LEGWIGYMNWRDGLEGWIKEMDGMDGHRIGQRDGQIKGGGMLYVLLYLFYFREKRNFRIFVQNPFSRNAKFSHFREQFSRKIENDFCSYFHENFAKIYFRPNSNRTESSAENLQFRTEGGRVRHDFRYHG